MVKLLRKELRMFTKKNFCIYIALILILSLSGTSFAVSASRLRKPAGEGDAEAQFQLGLAYLKGDGVKKDYKLALNWIRKAVAQEHVKAQGILGVMYELGYGVPKNIGEAKKWYLKSAEHGNPDAEFYLGNLYFSLNDYSQAFDWWERAGQHNHAGAICNLGYLFEVGAGGSQSLETAVELYKLAADLGDTQAKENLARLGISYNPQPQATQTVQSQSQPKTYKAKNYKDINSLYQAAQNGNASAQYQLAEAYFKGNGIQQDYQQARYWYQKSAEQNLIEAQYTLGMMYYQGAGTEKDYVQAEYWFTRAADNGDVNARNHLQAVAPQAEAQRRAEAQKAALAQKQAEEEARKRALAQKQAEQKRAKTAQKSSQPARQKQVQVWQCVKCGYRWDDNQLLRAFGLGAMFDAFNSLSGSENGLPPDMICKMGGHCVWKRIK